MIEPCDAVYKDKRAAHTIARLAFYTNTNAGNRHKYTHTTLVSMEKISSSLHKLILAWSFCIFFFEFLQTFSVPFLLTCTRSVALSLTSKTNGQSPAPVAAERDGKLNWNSLHLHNIPLFYHIFFLSVTLEYVRFRVGMLYKHVSAVYGMVCVYHYLHMHCTSAINRVCEIITEFKV